MENSRVIRKQNGWVDGMGDGVLAASWKESVAGAGMSGLLHWHVL